MYEVLYGTGWGIGKLKNCARAAYLFSEEQIRYAVRIQLTWTHIRSLMGVKDELARSFYMEMCSIEHWIRRIFANNLRNNLYLQL